jgi:hypothetical protein
MLQGGYLICRVSQDGVVPCKHIGDESLRVYKLESSAWSAIERLHSRSQLHDVCYTVIPIRMSGSVNIFGRSFSLDS